MSTHQVISATIEDGEPTLHDVLGAINQLSTHMYSEMGSLKSDVSSLKSEVNQVKSTMVTKDYLDEKISDLRGDLVVLVRKEDNKVIQLVNILHKRHVITPEDVETILALELFPKKVKAV